MKSEDFTTSGAKSCPKCRVCWKRVVISQTRITAYSLLKDPLNLSPDFRFDPQSQYLMRKGIPYYYLSRKEELLEEIRGTGLKVACYERVPKTPKHEPFQAGGLLVNAIKP
jgi:hypothetical protein